MLKPETFQEQSIAEFGKKICNVVKYWKPVSSQFGVCNICGEKHYYIIAHILDKHNDEIR